MPTAARTLSLVFVGLILAQIAMRASGHDSIADSLRIAIIVSMSSVLVVSFIVWIRTTL